MDEYTVFKESLSLYLKNRKVHDFSGQGIHSFDGKGDFVIHKYGMKLTYDEYQELLRISQNWPYQIRKVSYEDLYVRIFLDRSTAIKKGMMSIFSSITPTYGATSISYSKILVIRTDEAPDEISRARFSLLKTIITNFAKITGYSEIFPSDVVSPLPADKLCKVYITHKSNSHIPDGYKRLVCSTVSINKNTTAFDQADVTITYRKYEMLKEMEIKTIGGEYMSAEMVHDLINPVIAFELLSVKHNKTVTLHCLDNKREFNHPVLSVLYNLIRLDAILTQFNAKVLAKEYSPLPPHYKVNFTFLETEKEWELMRNFILPFPSILRRSIDELDEGKVNVHGVFSFLISFSRAISSYYQTTKILLDPTPYLLPYIYARIYLVKALKHILVTGLTLLEIKSPEHVVF